MKIGRDFISLSHGKEIRMKKTCLLRMYRDDQEIADAAEKFRNETGVVPVIID
ncbi:hypothetical protein [Geosporobacter subterraneus]|uniref:hypothetical protein n=1 Tax=Geosporobacter subterraneus TaxID=390806 RepID=UPI0016780867|nr:hypothetical protein [Geosporobacter subterraneus]